MNAQAGFVGDTAGGTATRVPVIVWLAFAIAILSAAAGLVSGPGNRFGWWDYRMAFGVLRWAAWGGVAGAALSLAALVLAGVADVGDLAPLGALVVSTLAVSTAGLALGIAISAFAAGRTQAVALAVALWFLFALGMDLALAGLGPAVHLGPKGLLAAVLLNPLEAARILAMLAAEPSGTALGPFGAYVTGAFGVGGAAALLAGAIALWIVAPLALARWAFPRRAL